ncbi:hypothetical protein DER45DRAFT_639112 [Fusarium avenaceum]|nr:hypothetical protein DER45DRAFT_639112 [Fusarium avenaceum]
MAESVQTRPGDPPRFDYAVPVVTALAALDNRDVIYGRQMYGNCGYYEHDDYTEWQTWMCRSGSVTATACDTINNYFGCILPITTVCYASNRGCSTQDSQALCCTRLGYPECATAYKAVGRRRITAFGCAISELEVSIYESTDFSTSQSDEDNSSTVSTRASISTKNNPTTTESTPARQTSWSDNDPKDSSTPIGPIVGGVIGGLALVALIGFGLWFIRRRKHIPSHRDSNLHSTANYHPQPQALPDYDYENPTYNAPPSDHPLMSSAPRNGSQNLRGLH